MATRTQAAPSIPTVGRAYLGTVIVSGMGAVGLSLLDAQQSPLPYQWYMLAALTLVSGSATVNLPTVGASISVSETFVFASVLLFGPAAGTITVALDGLVISFWMAKRRPEWYRALFNMAAPAISIWIAAHLLFAIARVPPLFDHQSPVPALFLPLIIFAVVYFGLNSWLIAFAVAFEGRLSPYSIWRKNFLWLSLNYFSGASVALLLVGYSNNVDVRFIGVIVPLLLVLYLTFKTTMGRVEDATSHLQQVNRMYLSTIETLAMFVDAKDQITHGHIRRVQQYSVRLARELGVSDERLIKAIEAAALLHDMGKLAVPEYILNKPGKLTPAEFEKMKLHAPVGADILAAIEFPYPVVPIVRHHHENWDGTGYPDGLKATEIPIGARILSVVDCFDALVSDRPYRPRLKDQDALAILLERRGVMYDPLVVDTFVRVHKDFEVGPSNVETKSEKLAVQSGPRAPTVHLGRTYDTDKKLNFYDLARALSGHTCLADASELVARQIRRLVPSTLCVFFVYDVQTDELVARHVVGEAAAAVLGARISLGQRLSGWVAANRQTILNSDPALDLGDAARSLQLRACISTPLLADAELVGVLSLYSSVTNAFDDDHRRLLEVASRQLAFMVKQSMPRDPSSDTDRVARLPQLEAVEDFIRVAGLQRQLDFGRATVLVIEVMGLKNSDRLYARTAGSSALRYVADQTSNALRATDILFTYGPRKLVAFLSSAEPESSKELAQRVHNSVLRNPAHVGGSSNAVGVSLVCIPAPEDVASLTALVDRAGAGSHAYEVVKEASIAN